MSGTTIHRTGTIEPEGEAPAVRRVRLRRNKPSFRVELTPLIDVIFLLLKAEDEPSLTQFHPNVFNAYLRDAPPEAYARYNNS